MSDEVERVWNLMEKFPLCTLATWNGDELRSRPMTAFVRRRTEAIYLLVDATACTAAAIRAHPDVCLTFADSANGQIVSIAGFAQMSADRSAIRELWSTPARHCWDSADNPDIRMLRITPREARFWDRTSTQVLPMATRPAGAIAKNGPEAAP